MRFPKLQAERKIPERTRIPKNREEHKIGN